MRAQAAAATGKRGLEDVLLSAQSDTEAYFGRLDRARVLSNEAVDSARRFNANEAAALWYVNAAVREVEFGNYVQARQGVQEALKLSTGRNVEVVAAQVLARAGGADRVRKTVDNLNQRFPLDTLLQHYWLPTIRATLALPHNPQHAINLLRATLQYDLATPNPFSMGTMYPVYIRGLAYLKGKQPQLAAEQFSNILKHRGITQNFPLGALAHVQLARALAASRDTAGARREYQDFFGLWKDADPDIPILKEAKAEYAKLN